MKTFASIVIAPALATLLGACTAPNDPAPISSSADAYFFQPDLTQVYTYFQDHASASDTVTYQTSLVNPSSPYDSYLQLKNNRSTSGGSVLYYFKAEQISDGSVLCLLANSPTDKGFVALKGSLDLGVSWYADTMLNVLATVVGKYAEFYLPGRQVHYNDVVVVKYTDKTVPSTNYTIRYFARYYGLILERMITGTSSETSDLQLLSRQSTTSSANPDTHHDRWYDANGRYMANMKSIDDLDK